MLVSVYPVHYESDVVVPDGSTLAYDSSVPISRATTIALKHFSATDIASFVLDVHAGVGESSVSLALRPALVHRGFKKLPSQSGRTFGELQAIASRRGWQGDLSTPSKVTLAYGGDIEAW